jgi:hypothetical protein
MVATSVLHNICLEANDIDAPPAPEEINDKIWMCCIVRFDRYDYTMLLLIAINIPSDVMTIITTADVARRARILRHLRLL